MKIDITENKENALMKRNVVRTIIHHEGKATPSRLEILEYLSKSLKANKENIVINKIFGIKGLDQSEAKVTVYKDKKDIPKALAEKMKRRNKPSVSSEKKEKAQAPTAEAPAETPEEKPKEEVKEEPKNEAPKEEPKAESQEKPAEEAPKAEEKAPEQEEKPAAEEKKE